MSSTSPINIGFPKAPLSTTGAPSTSRCIDGCQNPDGPDDRVRFGAANAEDESRQDDLTEQQQKPFNLKKTLQKLTSGLFVQSLINSVMPFLVQIVSPKYLDYVTPTTQDAIKGKLGKLSKKLEEKNEVIPQLYDEKIKSLISKGELSATEQNDLQTYWNLIKAEATKKTEMTGLSCLLLDRLKTLHGRETQSIKIKGVKGPQAFTIEKLKELAEENCQKQLAPYQRILSCETLDAVKTELAKIVQVDDE